MSVNIKQNEDDTLSLVNSKGKVLVTFGQGTTDTDITYMKTINADGEVCYIYGNAAQNGITVSGTKP